MAFKRGGGKGHYHKRIMMREAYAVAFDMVKKGALVSQKVNENEAALNFGGGEAPKEATPVIEAEVVESTSDSKALVISRTNEIMAELKMENGKVFCSSLDVARRFGKDHKNVLQSIQKYQDTEELREFSRLNCQPSNYLSDRGKTYPMYLMSRDGFSFLVMGFNGKEANIWKECYIAAFNAMEKRLLEIDQPRIPSTYVEALKALVKSEEEKEKQMQLLQHATIALSNQYRVDQLPVHDLSFDPHDSDRPPVSVNVHRLNVCDFPEGLIRSELLGLCAMSWQRSGQVYPA